MLGSFFGARSQRLVGRIYAKAQAEISKHAASQHPARGDGKSSAFLDCSDLNIGSLHIQPVIANQTAPEEQAA
jgi:hypothetical protein